MDVQGLMNALGVDYEKTMPRFVGDEDFYASIVTNFFEKSPLEGVEELLAKEEYEKAFALVHNAKGVSLNLGMDRLSEYLVPLTEALRNPPYDADLITQYEKWSLEEYENLKILFEAWTA